MRHVPSVQPPSVRRCSLSCTPQPRRAHLVPFSLAARNSSPSCSVFLSAASCAFVLLAPAPRRAPHMHLKFFLSTVTRAQCDSTSSHSSCPRGFQSRVRCGNHGASNSERLRQSHRPASHWRKRRRQTRPSPQRAATTRPRNSYSSTYTYSLCGMCSNLLIVTYSNLS